MRKSTLLLLAGLFLFAWSASAYASDLTGKLTADNFFEVYLSTDAHTLGTKVLTSDMGASDWQSPETLNLDFGGLTTYYLHVKAWDATPGGSGAGFLGDLTLNNANYVFAANSGSTLATTYANWEVYSDSAYTTSLAAYELDRGANVASTLPWKNTYTGSISSGADWLWTNVDGSKDVSATRYFTTTITVTPEPVSAGLFLLGGGALAFFRRKKA